MYYILKKSILYFINLYLYIVLHFCSLHLVEEKKKYFHQSSNLVKIHFLFSYFKYHIDYNLFDLV